MLAFTTIVISLLPYFPVGPAGRVSEGVSISDSPGWGTGHFTYMGANLNSWDFDHYYFGVDEPIFDRKLS